METAIGDIAIAAESSYFIEYKEIALSLRITHMLKSSNTCSLPGSGA